MTFYLPKIGSYLVLNATQNKSFAQAPHMHEIGQHIGKDTNISETCKLLL